MLQTARRIAWCSHRRGRAAPCRALSDYHVPGLVLSARRVFTQEDVDAFLQLTGDANPIHRRHGGANAVVPGLLCASLFPGIIGSNFVRTSHRSYAPGKGTAGFANQPTHVLRLCLPATKTTGWIALFEAAAQLSITRVRWR